MIDKSEFGEIPQILIDSEKKKMFYELKHDLEHHGIEMEQYLKDIKKTEEQIFKDFDDQEMRDAKIGQFWVTEPQRMLANNSAVYNTKPTETEFLKEWTSLIESGAGERGIFNRESLYWAVGRYQLYWLILNESQRSSVELSLMKIFPKKESGFIKTSSLTFMLSSFERSIINLMRKR